jgi:hypothetical protein
VKVGGDKDPTTHYQPGRNPGSGPKPENYPVTVWSGEGDDSVVFEVLPTPKALKPPISEDRPTGS